ncbi:MAG TPA: TadE family protein [Aeromicrobium sp.]|nr:TadE family protein [Aeromicrobium sp.]
MKRVGHRRARGQTLVEFAMVLPIIILLVMGTVDLGRAVFTYNTLAQSARSASRLAIVNQNITNVRNEAIASAATLGLTSSNVDVCFKRADSTLTSCSSTSDNCPQSTRDIGCLAIVTTHMTYSPMTPVISLIFSSFALSSTSVASIEYVCPEGPASTCP